MIGKTARISAVALVFLFATVAITGHVLAVEDSDGDGLPDAWELEHFGDLSQGPDTDFDGDGASNLAEFDAGTNPSDPNDRPNPPDSKDQ